MAQLEPRVVYSPCADATPEGELNALASIYRFILNCVGTGDRAPNSGPDDDATKIKHVCAATEILPE
jgi:hypothetical protein